MVRIHVRVRKDHRIEDALGTTKHSYHLLFGRKGTFGAIIFYIII
jgi:hypothetical protein